MNPHGVIKLLSDIWSIKKPTPLDIKEVYVGFEDILKHFKGKQEKDISLRILEYLFDNTELDLETWKKAEVLLIEAGILTRGGVGYKRAY